MQHIAYAGAEDDGREWSPEVVEIGEAIVNLTLKDAVLLSQYLEEVHGIKCSNGVPQLPNTQDQPQPETKVEQTEWAVILEGYEPDKKIGLIKVHREVTGLGLKEAKDAVENGIGKPIKEGLPKAEAEALKAKFEAAGARVSLK